MSQKTILEALVRGGLSPIGACAVGGNMMAESGMVANIAQRGMTNLSDAQYTAAADAGTIDFVHDGIGYGLIQLTYYSRKQNYLAYARSLGVSVGNEDAQVQFCLKELREEYPSLFAYLRQTKLLYEAAGRVCAEYERPAVNNIRERADYGDKLYMQYGSALEAIANGSSTTVISENSSASKPNSHISKEVTEGRSPEAKYLAALLEKLGYDVLWLGLSVCIADFKQKTGCSNISQMWDKLLKN